MSRIGNKIIEIPADVTVEVKDSTIICKEKLGEEVVPFDLNRAEIKIEGNILTVIRKNEEKHTKQLHGTYRALISNAIIGVSKGFTKTLQVIGIGYHADMKGKDIIMSVGYSHTITISPLEGVEIKILDIKGKEVNSTIEVFGKSKFAVGQTAALIRDTRPPEPYGGKGVRYKDEVVLRKEGKRAGK